MNGYIKYFQNGGKKMSLIIKIKKYGRDMKKSRT